MDFSDAAHNCLIFVKSRSGGGIPASSTMLPSCMSVIRPRRWATLILLLCFAFTPAQADQTWVQLWEISAYPLMDLQELDHSALEDLQAARILRNPAANGGTRPGYSFGLFYEARTGDADNSERDPAPRMSQTLPQHVGLAWSRESHGLILGYEQLYNSHRLLDWPTVDGLIPRRWDSRVDAWGWQSWLKLPAPLPGELHFGLGGQRLDLVLDQFQLKQQITDYRYQAGLDWRKGPVSLSLGWESEVTWKQRLVWASGTDDLLIWGRLPESWHLGAATRLDSLTELELRLHHLRWSRQELAFSDRTEFSLIARRQGPAGSRLQLGLTSSGSTSDAYPLYAGGEQSTWFLMAGFSLPIGPAEWSLKLADSHLGSGEWRRQTILQSGFALRF
jgi:hypothetical protein